MRHSVALLLVAWCACVYGALLPALELSPRHFQRWKHYREPESIAIEATFLEKKRVSEERKSERARLASEAELVRRKRSPEEVQSDREQRAAEAAHAAMAAAQGFWNTRKSRQTDEAYSTPRPSTDMPSMPAFLQMRQRNRISSMGWPDFASSAPPQPPGYGYGEEGPGYGYGYPNNEAPKEMRHSGFGFGNSPSGALRFASHAESLRSESFAPMGDEDPWGLRLGEEDMARFRQESQTEEDPFQGHMPAPNTKRFNYYDREQMPAAPPEPGPPPLYASEQQPSLGFSDPILSQLSDFAQLASLGGQVNSREGNEGFLPKGAANDAKDAAVRFMGAPNTRRMPPLPRAPPV